LDNPGCAANRVRDCAPEARAPTDLTDYLDGDLLVEPWPRLVLPKTVRAA
jgi:hypothetical protein